MQSRYRNPMQAKVNLDPRLCQLLTEFRHELKKLYGEQLVQLILYGSYARGQAHADSDVDVAVILKPPILPATEILRIGEVKTLLNLKYDELLSVLPIAESDFKTKDTPLLANIHREGMIV